MSELRLCPIHCVYDIIGYGDIVCVFYIIMNLSDEIKRMMSQAFISSEIIAIDLTNMRLTQTLSTTFNLPKHYANGSNHVDIEKKLRLCVTLCSPFSQ